MSRSRSRHRTVQRPSDAGILDALRPLWVLRKEDGSAVWYQWGRVPAHARRILEALQIPVTRRLVWDTSGYGWKNAPKRPALTCGSGDVAGLDGGILI